MVALETVTNRYLGGDTSLACSIETQTAIDHQVMALVKKQYEKAYKLLEDNRESLEKIARTLYEQETITGEEFMELLDRENEDKAEENTASPQETAAAATEESLPEESFEEKLSKQQENADIQENIRE